MLKLVTELEPEAVFDPDTLEILTAAFDAAWASVQASGITFLQANGGAERAREIIGRHIIEAAKNGERDRQRLCDEALLQFARSDLEGRHKRDVAPHAP
jgi:hypothetical protein